MHQTRSNSVLALVGVFSLLSAPSAMAGSISLEWDPAPGAAGYRVHYGESAGSYGQFVDVGPSTRATLDALDDCTTYHVAVKAYNAAGESPDFSNDISGWARPTIDSIDPGEAEQGSQQTLNIHGANFDGSAEVSYEIVGLAGEAIGTDLVRLENVSVISCNQIQALMTVEPTARGERAMEVGDFAVEFEVRNPDLVVGAGEESLSVVFREERADVNPSDASTQDRVDGKDLVWLARAYGSLAGEGAYMADADLNGDGLVDGDDLVYLAVRFGRCWDGQTWSTQHCP